jgi:pimeloyl-ACP methyl ester carboxylesterase
MKKFTIVILILFSIHIEYTDIQAQVIKRKGWFGTIVTQMNDSIARALRLRNNTGVLVLSVMPKFTGDKLKLKENDVIVKINNQEIIKLDDFTRVIKELREGDEVTCQVERKSRDMLLKAITIAKAHEISENADIIYDEVKLNGGYLRTIINKPKNEGKYPAILFIPGYTCISLDNLDKNHPYTKVINGWSNNGYVVMRIEKPGLGDCLNTPNCESTDFNTEISVYEVAYKALKKYDFVDTSKIVIFGHSMGGSIATILAERYNPKGIIVFGTNYRTWYEYMIDVYRNQNILLGMDYAENDKEFRKLQPLLYQLFIEKIAPSELAKDKSNNELLQSNFEYNGKDLLWSRNYKFWQQIDQYSFINEWKNIHSNVLSVWGEYDIQAFSEIEHQTIAKIVNYYHPGKATYLKLKGMNHSFIRVPSYKEGDEIMEKQNKDYIWNNFNYEFVTETIKWMKKIL